MGEEPLSREIWNPSAIAPVEFELLEPLAEGAYGSVYKAMHKTMSKVVAIKFIRKESFADDDALLQYFQKEARAIAKLEHPNIVRVLQVGLASNETPFLVYEYLEGETLRSYLQRRKTLSIRSLFCLFSQVLKALSHAHSNGIIHRDIKPENIMLLPEQSSSSIFHVKLLDFGIAKMRAPTEISTQAQTSTSNIAGSPAYSSPEQCKGEPCDQRSDLYSLACVLYECLLGVPPFSSDNPMHTMYQQINSAPPLPDKKLPSELNKFLSKSLSKNPSERSNDCKEFEHQLRSSLKALERQELTKSTFPNILKVALPLAFVSGIGILAFFHLEAETQSKQKRTPCLQP